MLALAPLARASVSSLPDDPTWTANVFGGSGAWAVAADGDRAWAAGNFHGIAPRTGPGTGLSPAGQRIPGYSELTDPTGGVLAVDAAVGDGAGGWYVAGNFNKAAGVTMPGLVHLRSDGSLDTGFDAQAPAGTVKALALSGSSLYVAGSFSGIGRITQAGVAKLNATTGDGDGTWAPSITGTGFNVKALFLAGSVLYAGGSFTSGTLIDLVAIDAGTGTVNTAFNPNPSGGPVNAIYATGASVYFGGFFSTVFGAASARLVKVDLAGPALDAAWAPAPNGTVNGLASDGTDLYVAGSFTDVHGVARHGVAAVPLVSATGTPTGWYPGDVTTGMAANAITLAGGNVYFGGSFEDVGGTPRAGLASAAAGAAGTLTGWDPAPNSSVRAIAATPTAVYAGGTFTGVNGVRRLDLAPIDLLTGVAMPFFSSHTITGNAENVYAVAVCGNSVYIGGSFGAVDGQNRINAAAFDRNTGALTAWDPSPENDVYAIACGDGVVYIGGQFLNLNSSTTNLPLRGGLAATDPGTGVATAWDPGVGLGATFVDALAVRGSTVYVGGQFNSLGSPAVPRNDLAAIDAAPPGAATPWDPNVTGGVTAIALGQSELYAVGSLTQVGGTPRTRAAAVRLSDGGLDLAWDPAPDALVYSVAAAPDGTVYMGGAFANVGGQPRSHAAAVAADGTVTSWNPGPDNLVLGITAGTDGRIYLAGTFSGVAGRASSMFATFSEPTSFATQPALTSAPVAGRATTCDPGTPGGSLPAPQDVQWRLDGADVAGATGTTYTPATTDIGHALSCHVSQRNLISSAQADSASVTVAAPAQAPPAPFDIDGFKTPPPPVKGKSVIATPIRGTVLVLLPGFKTFIPLPDAERIPVRSVLDTQNGVVQLTTVGAKGKLQSASFYGGQFQIFQTGGKRPMVELRLYGGNFKVCPRITRKAAALSKVAKTKSIRHLWGNGKGLFRTKGRYASATIRGTKWLTDDRCDGTLIRVAKGSVTVRDIPKKKSLVLKAPKKYLALARR